MYKKTSDSTHYLDRTGSHATKESPRGVISSIPPEAREPEEYYQGLKAQMEELSANLYSVRERVTYLKARLKNKLPYEEFLRFRGELDRAGPLLQQLENRSGELRLLARVAAQDAWGYVFAIVAEELLDHDTYMKIDHQVAELLGRERQEIEKGHRQKSDHRREKDNRRAKLREKRDAFRFGYRVDYNKALSPHQIKSKG